jgi:hypothetical protein
MLANTSLNDRGEPLVDSAAQALTFCVCKAVRVAYIDDVRVVLRRDAAETMPLHDPRPRRAEPFERDAARWSELWREWTDRGLSPEALFIYAGDPRLRDSIDPWSAAGARMATVVTTAFYDKASERERRFVDHLTRTIGPGADVIAAQSSDEFVGGG